MELDGYRTEAEIARGAQGVVYSALEVRSGRRVALKVLLEVSKSLLGRFDREAEVLARLRHPNVVAVHGAGRAQGRPYIVMELVEGRSLSQALSEQGAFEQREAARIVRDLARGAGHAHAQGLVHRDIKPANAILRPDGTVLLTDFGLARDQESSSDLSKTGIFMGTPGFASPEQASGEGKRVGPASDVYGLGALLFALLCNRPPVEGSLLEVVIATVSGPVPSLRDHDSSLDQGLESICLRCFAKDPSSRYPEGNALADELDRYLEGEAIQGVQRRSSAPLVFAGLGVLCALGVGATAIFVTAPDDPVLASVSQGPAAETPRLATPSAEPPAAPRPDPGLDRSLRLVRSKTREDELGSAIEILSEALARAAGASNRAPAQQLLADLYTRRARRLFQRGPEEVSADLRRAESLDPSAPRRRILSEALLRQALHANGDLNRKEDWPPARALLRESVQLAPDDPRPALALGDHAATRRDWDTALEGFEEAIRRDPASSAATLGLGNSLLHLGRAEEGIQRVTAYLQLHPDALAPRAGLGVLLRARYRWAEARRAYAAAAKQGRSGLAQIGLAWVALEERRPTQALAEIEAARGREFEIATITGSAAFLLGEHKRAAASLRGVIEMDPPRADLALTYLRALNRSRAGKQAAAGLAKFEKDALLSPTELLCLRAHFHADRREHAQAAKTFQALAEALRGTDDAWSGLRMATHFSAWGRYHNPKLVYQLAIQAAAARSDDDDADAWALAGKARLLQHRYPEARELLERSHKIHPSRLATNVDLSRLAVHLKNYEAGIEVARRCLALEPVAPYASISGIEACIGSARYAEAQPFLAVAAKHIPKNGALRALRAIVAIELGKPSEAKADVAWLRQKPLSVPGTLAQAAYLVSEGGAGLAEAQALLKPLLKRPDRGWTVDYARLLLQRIAKSR